METTVVLSCVLVLGGWGGIHGVAAQRSESNCSAIIYDVSYLNDSHVQECLKHPEVVAVNEGYSGPEAGRKTEILLQCVGFAYATGYNKGVLDAAFMRLVAQQFVAKVYLTGLKKGLDSCDFSLVEAYRMTEYKRCLVEYCEGS